MLGRLGTSELLMIVVIVIIVFGPKNLPKIGKIFGETISNFRTSMKDGEDKSENNTEQSETQEDKKE